MTPRSWRRRLVRGVRVAAALALALEAMQAAAADARETTLRVAPTHVAVTRGGKPCPARTDLIIDAVHADGRRLDFVQGIGTATLLYGRGLVVYVDSRPGRRDAFRVANGTARPHRVVIRWHYQRRHYRAAWAIV